ncbi:MAG: hypothetical protein LBM96_04695 [Methanobrevibacter sp.]|jgi:hypothetical protein|nr:hypothetical protein [Candidatus Methanoflexus mossambicus]
MKLISPLFENLGFNHQYCTVHSKKNINKKIKEYIRNNKVSNEDINLIKLFKKDIFELYDCESYDDARHHFDCMLYLIEGYPVIIRSIILDSIMPYFKTYFYHLIDDNVDATNNKIENYFLKTFPRHVKKIMKTFDGTLSRICLRQKFWGEYNEIQI